LNYFLNHTESEKKCYQARIQEIEKSKAKFCDDWQEELQSYVNQNIMTCVEANDQFQKMKCSILSCR